MTSRMRGAEHSLRMNRRQDRETEEKERGGKDRTRERDGRKKNGK